MKERFDEEELANCARPSANGRWQLDLSAANRLEMERAGLQQIQDTAPCTACHSDEFFSHRAEGGRTGRFGALLCLLTIAPPLAVTSEGIAPQLEALRARITAACERANRDPSGVILVAITKTLPPARIREAYAVGLRDFGENRLEEAREKLPALREELPEACWHMVGHVQSRKATAIPPLFNCLHSLDSLKLARRLGRFANEQGRILPVLVQCNVSGEASKGGFPRL